MRARGTNLDGGLSHRLVLATLGWLPLAPGRFRDVGDQAALLGCFEELLHFRGLLNIRGWAFHPDGIESAYYSFGGRRYRRLPGWPQRSKDIEAVHGPRARRVRFSAALQQRDPFVAQTLSLRFRLRTGGFVSMQPHPAGLQFQDSAASQLTKRFVDTMHSRHGGVVLEIGSRNRSGMTRRDWAGTMEYTGFDVAPGDNVDVVGDAHVLSGYFPAESFDGVFTISTFEHLAMPWKVAVEINRVMKTGALLFVQSHQTWPLHEEPFDFWRFSSHAWQALFNAQTGFQVLDTAMGEPASIVPHFMHPVNYGMETQPAQLVSSVLVQKTGPTTLTWDVDVMKEWRAADYPSNPRPYGLSRP
jgi:Methyltransferase domain